MASIASTGQEILKTKTVLVTGNDVAAKRQEIKKYFNDTFTLFEKLFEILPNDKDFQTQAEPLRHPHIFYWGHTACFLINKLRLARVLTERIDPKVESICAVGVDEMSWDDLNSEHYDWPSAAYVRDYRNKVRAAVNRLMEDMPLTLPITWESPWWIILMGCEHERIHLETSSVLLRQTNIELIKEHPMWQPCPSRRNDPTIVPGNSLLEVPAAAPVLERAKDESPMYGWDLEFGTPAPVETTAFKASQYLVSNKEFFEFMKDGGYQNEDYWTPEGRRFAQWKGPNHGYHPVFWVPVTDQEGKSESKWSIDGVTYRYRCMTSVIDMPWDWPVDVNQLEAKAFCNWKAAKTSKPIRLPTEAEWTALRDYAYPQTRPDEADQPYWESAPGNINLEYYASSCPIDAFVFKGGFCDVIGNVWQHTETPIDGFKGFQTHRYYDDFSVPTFDQQHNCIKGGSWISTGNEATRLARYAFRRHFYQHAGFRYIESEVPAPAVEGKQILWEREPQIASHLSAHYGDDFKGIPNFPKRIADFCIAEFKKLRTDVKNKEVKSAETNTDSRNLTETKGFRALDVGCGPGRCTLELGKYFDHVMGLDLTTKYARLGTKLSEGGAVKWALSNEGEIETYFTTDLDSLGLAHVADSVDFMQTDCNNMDPKYKNYDLVVVSNVLEFLYDPALFLSQIHQRMRPNAVLVICSTFNWDEKYTPKDKWLGGYKESAENVWGWDGLTEALSEHFTQMTEGDFVPFAVQQAKRRFLIDSSHVTVWQLKEQLSLE